MNPIGDFVDRTRRRAVCTALLPALLSAAVCAADAPMPDALATTIVVTTTADDLAPNGNCTLREAVLAANGDVAVDACPAGSGVDTIRLVAGIYELRLSGPDDAGLSGDLDVSSQVVVLGAGMDATRIDGGEVERTFDVAAGGLLELSRLSVRGRESEMTAEGRHVRVRAGGRLEADAVRFEGVRLAAPNPIIDPRDTTAGAGGDNETRQALYIEGGATLVLRRCVVENMLAFGALRTLPSSTTLIRACLFRNNQRDFGIGGAVDNEGAITIVESTFSRNVAEDGGGAFGNRAAGEAVIVNSTFESNSAIDFDTRGGGAILNDGRVTIRSSTIAYNTIRGGVGAVGPGILTDARAGSPGVVDIANTLLARNAYFFIRATEGGKGVEDCGGSGSVISRGYSIVGETTRCPFVDMGPGNLLDINSMLGVPGNHGGPTPTVRLQPGSPAIDAGDPAGCSDHGGDALPTDQRGFVRLGRCDIGAFEAGSPGSDPLFRDEFEGP